MAELLLPLGQFGAVGLVAAVLLWTNLKHQRQMGERLAKLETTLIGLVQNNTTAMNRISNVISRLNEVAQNPVAAREIQDAGQPESGRIVKHDG